jgi:transcriptional regulator with XRE-family HTH domain
LGKKSRHSISTREFDILQAILREAREGAGLSQREMARRLGFHPTIFGKVERGDRVLDVIEFVAFAKAADIAPNELLDKFLERISQPSDKGDG